MNPKTKESAENHLKINWKEILVFYIIAVLVSAPFRLNLIQLSELIPLPYGLNIFYRILRGIGPAIGFIIVYYILKSKTEKKLTFWGNNSLFSLIAILVIPIGLAFAGVDNQENLNRNYYGLLTGVFLIFYALGEEYGWRGYLQEALSPLKLPLRIFIIALLWYVWHLNFLLPDFTVKTHLVFFSFLLLGSWGLLKISESTYSMLFVVAVHLSFNILSDVHADSNRKLIVIGIAVLVWTVLIILENKNKMIKIKS